MDKMYHRIIIGMTVLILLVFGIFLGVVPLVEHLNKPAYLEILVEPNTARVEIGGKEYRNAIYEFEPGVYAATVTGPNGETEELEFQLEKNQTTGLYLELKDGEWRGLTAEDLAKKNNINSILPIEFSVCGTPAKRTNCDAIQIQYERTSACGGGKCLVITGRRSAITDEVLAQVREKLAENGYELSDYQYVYVQNDNR